MSALRKQEPFPTTDAASQKRDSVGAARHDVLDEAAVDPATRRPPQPAAAPVTDDGTDRAIDDTYDGEILNSTVDEFDEVDETDQTNQTGRTNQIPPPQKPRASGPDQTPRPQAASPQAGREDTHLFEDEELRDFRARWDQVQTSFVDEPRHAVEQADALVGTVVKRIADQFSDERAKLEKQWTRGENVSTEDLRQGFKRYRAFFDRLLGATSSNRAA
ncbi:MAG TPA: hypothetical protein VIY53_04715 [Acidobacteriaceae bacterium]